MQKLEHLKPGKIYKIVQRGNNGDLILFERYNEIYFRGLVEKHLSPVGEIFQCRFLPTQIELVIRFRTEEEIPSRYKGRLYIPFSNMFNSYAKSINKRYNRTGSLFKRRFERTEILN